MSKGIAVKCLDCGLYMQPDTSKHAIILAGHFGMHGEIIDYWKCLKCHKEITTRRKA